MNVVGQARTPLVLTVVAVLGIASSCNPTDPAATGTGNAPSIGAISNRTVFPGEPIDLAVSAVDAEGDQVSYSLASGPSGATIDNSTGLFSWRPALTDSGENTIVFEASDGSTASTVSATFTVEIPSLGETEAIRILRPLEGDTFTYGDTLTIAFAMKYCGLYALPQIYTPGMANLCSVAPSTEYHPVRDLDDSTDVDGRISRFSRRFPDRDMWIGYYRLPLVEKTIDQVGCSIEFGGGTEVRDSIFLQIKDPYGDQRNECDPATAPQIMNALLTGTYCRFFNVAPRQ